MSELLQKNDFSFCLLNAKKYLKLLRNIKGNNNVFFIDDNEFKRIIVTNGNIKVYLPKQIEDTKKTIAIPEFNEDSVIGKPINIDKELRNSLSKLIADSEHIDLIIKDNQLKAISVTDTAVYTFDEFVSENIDDTNADKLLQCYTFLSILAEQYTLNVCKDIENKYWLVTTCDLGYIQVYVYEVLSEAGMTII